VFRFFVAYMSWLVLVPPASRWVLLFFSLPPCAFFFRWGDLLWNTEFKLLPAHPWVRNPLPKILNFFAQLGLVPEQVSWVECCVHASTHVSVSVFLYFFLPALFFLACLLCGGGARCCLKFILERGWCCKKMTEEISAVCFMTWNSRLSKK